MNNKIKLILILFLFIFVRLCSTSFATSVLFVDVSDKPSIVKQQLELACRFYGLDIELLLVEQEKGSLHISNFIKKKDIVAIVITGKSLPYLNARIFLTTTKKDINKDIPVLIIGVNSTTDKNNLSQWSGGVVKECISSINILNNGFYKITDSKDIARELAGQDIPFSGKMGCYLIINKTREFQSIMGIKNDEGILPIFAKANIDGQGVFFQAEINGAEFSQKPRWRFSKENFFEIAPLMMFLRYSCGEQCWHSVNDHANLTIDDPWLTEPYGHLSYEGLLEEMQKANFYTTIASIPWNYDRSKPEVISLFQEYPDRFSICIHGNNHDHYEFYKYKTNVSDPLPAVPLNVQETNIKQAIARMEKFKELTELSYDKIMVFPHGIAPAKTLGILKKCNFLATVNAGNVPLGLEEPADPLFNLRPVTLQFENFPSLNRYSPNERTRSDIAIDLFLGNPILFYVHHDFFKNGINAFNKTAKIVNSIQPDIKWKSLGYIIQHLYLEKLRDDGNYDILTFSNNIFLENKHQRDVIYFVHKDESFSLPIKHVTVNGKTVLYSSSNNELGFTILIPSGESRNIVIEYENELDLASIDISKKNIHVNLLRKLSDFRDMTLSSNVLARTITYYYYETNLYKLGIKRLAILLFLLIVFVVLITYHYRKRFKQSLS